MKKGNAYLYLVIVFFLWGSVYPASKFAMATLPTVVMVCGRFLVSVPALFFIGRKQIKAARIDRSDWKYFALIGFLGYFLSTIFNTLSLNYIDASMGSLFNSLTPVGITVMAALVLKEHISLRHILCLALALAGAIVITGGAEGEGQVLGLILVLLCILSFSFSSVTMRPLSRKYGALVVTAYSMLVSLIGYIPAAAVSLVRVGGVQITAEAVLAVVYMGLFATALAHTLWGKCLSMLEASRCSMFYPLQALFGSLLGALLLGERFTPAFFIGAVMIAAGVIISCREKRERRQLK